VWIVPEGDADRLDFHASSDSAIVSGLIALVLRVYGGGHRAADIAAIEPAFIHAIGLGSHLSPTRSNGLAALLQRIREVALRAEAGEQFAPA
jgi:cysteine desulfuration protein SufE